MNWTWQTVSQLQNNSTCLCLVAAMCLTTNSKNVSTTFCRSTHLQCSPAREPPVLVIYKQKFLSCRLHHSFLSSSHPQFVKTRHWTWAGHRVVQCYALCSANITLNFASNPVSSHQLLAVPPSLLWFLQFVAKPQIFEAGRALFVPLPHFLAQPDCPLSAAAGRSCLNVDNVICSTISFPFSTHNCRFLATSRPDNENGKGCEIVKSRGNPDEVLAKPIQKESAGKEVGLLSHWDTLYVWLKQELPLLSAASPPPTHLTPSISSTLS